MTAAQGLLSLVKSLQEWYRVPTKWHRVATLCSHKFVSVCSSLRSSRTSYCNVLCTIARHCIVKERRAFTLDWPLAVSVTL